ncbi:MULTISPECIES: GntR family transcriptional regulator [Rhizobium/Agrobacterium group]|uniref:GntR family transcriptional regulator n=2 Tax=Neorhizobium TaxID=1525371 RepID=A0ABV0M453_9HYPH|nr:MULTISPECIES: GntR family transcriptional regulator [Rhizobium/Agrobacterium group]KGE02427.1 transcriptional regulator [Rhizobium sp. YS-1r]MBP1844007.1 DNA-binding GntR family transcriptional regulator [Neorhizobium petrolearium]MCC2613576.1 GntR family transcriptional regulator [Neorhizobium petrolearium]WGI71894.1 GntR family transcriptional regulator [Neorhizobium petrolearium]
MQQPKTFTTKTELARQHIQSMVLSGKVGPGDRITTREVSDALGISETPIREAIRSLASEGWLAVQNHIGAVVQGLKVEQIREISALRGLVCGLAVELGAASFDEERLRRIDENLEASAGALDADDFALFAEKNYEFHQLLCDNPESPWCKRLLENMHGLMSAQRHGIPPQPARLREALKEHTKIRDHLRGGDYAAAAAMVNQHEKNTGDFLIRMIEEMPNGGRSRQT